MKNEPAEMFNPDDEEEEDDGKNANVRALRESVTMADDELARYQSLVPNPNLPLAPLAPSSSKYSEIMKAFLTTNSMAVFKPSFLVTAPSASTSGTSVKNEPPSSSEKTANMPPSASTSVLFCELCGAKNWHGTKHCPQIVIPLFCDLCGVKDSHATKNCPQIATRVRCGECSQLGHPSIECTKGSRSVESASMKMCKEEPGGSDEVMLIYDSWAGSDEKPDVKKMNQSKSTVQMGKVKKEGDCLPQSQRIGRKLSRGMKRPTESEISSNKKCKLEPLAAEEVIFIDSGPKDFDVKPFKRIEDNETSCSKTSNVNLIEHPDIGEDSKDIEILSAAETMGKEENLPHSQKKIIKRLKKQNRKAQQKLKKERRGKIEETREREVKELEERLKSIEGKLNGALDENRKMKEDTGRRKLVELLT